MGHINPTWELVHTLRVWGFAMVMNSRFLLWVLMVLVSAEAKAAEEDFLNSLAGSWAGNGRYVRLNGDTVALQCRLASTASGSSISMEGSCTASGLVGRSFSADLMASEHNILAAIRGRKDEAL